eukprot:COSAG06_NODE_60093_length_272_cov_0.589595_1_plen_76_part_10
MRMYFHGCLCARCKLRLLLTRITATPGPTNWRIPRDCVATTRSIFTHSVVRSMMIRHPEMVHHLLQVVVKVRGMGM